MVHSHTPLICPLYFIKLCTLFNLTAAEFCQRFGLIRSCYYATWSGLVLSSVDAFHCHVKVAGVEYYILLDNNNMDIHSPSNITLDTILKHLFKNTFLYFVCVGDKCLISKSLMY